MRNFVKILLVVIWAIGLSSDAFAHSKVNFTSPEDGAVLKQVPASLQMQFGNKISLTKIRIYIEDQNPIDLGLDHSKGFEDRFSFPLSTEMDGKYRVEWRGLSIDGHVMQGEFTFTVE